MEGNELIAKFMGLEKENGLYLFTTPMDDYKTDTLYFDTSWDWLMPVVSKITRDEQYIGNDYREHLLDIVPYGLIEDTYNAVVEFIKWYNNNSFKTSSELAQNC